MTRALDWLCATPYRRHGFCIVWAVLLLCTPLLPRPIELAIDCIAYTLVVYAAGILSERKRGVLERKREALAQVEFLERLTQSDAKIASKFAEMARALEGLQTARDKLEREREGLN